MIPSLISSPHSFQLMVFDGVKNMKDVRRKVNAGEISASLVSTSVLCHSLPLLIAIEKSIQNRTGVDKVERWDKKNYSFKRYLMLARFFTILTSVLVKIRYRCRTWGSEE